MTQIAKDLCFEPCQSDNYLFRKRIKYGQWIFLLIYVDDILIVCKYGEEIKQVEQPLRRRLTVTTLDDIKWFLGKRIVKDSDEPQTGMWLRSKHIDTRLHYTKDLCASGKIVLKYCTTEDMIADILTKPLGSLKVKKFASELGLVSLSH